MLPRYLMYEHCVTWTPAFEELLGLRPADDASPSHGAATGVVEAGDGDVSPAVE